ncbi:MAG: hypothetical protein H6502_03805 [Candidatus Woesearchaeota archaeon]|nr:MAG: hypothetical protein H6502_03805 [Candidatus Woesearchaeota archaeon]
MELEQIFAINKAIGIGKRIADTFPLVGDMKVAGFSSGEIVNILGLTDTYQVNFPLACSAVKFALRGYDGSFRKGRRTPYKGLLTDEERALANERVAQATGKKVSRHLADYKKRHPEKMSEFGKKGHQARGYLNWTPTRIAFVRERAEDPEYAIGNNRRDILRITEEFNRRFRTNAGDLAIRKAVYRYRERE